MDEVTLFARFHICSVRVTGVVSFNKASVQE